MAFLQVNYYSNILDTEQMMNVILPESSNIHLDWTSDDLKDIPVIYLLHGMNRSFANWQRFTDIERLVRYTKVAIIMPNTDMAWYTNTTYGMNYFDALAYELPNKIKELFPQISCKKEKTFVVGQSMGGYGAFKLALRTNHFSYAASLSGALHFDKKDDELLAMASTKYWEGIFGDMSKFDNTDNDILYLAKKKIENKEELPKLYSWCGKQDFLFNANELVSKELLDLGYDITYEKSDGSHEWYYWSKMIERVLEFLPIDYQKEERL